eukprot:12730753-Alexandrium_andersonii.AAC.1
MDRLVVPGILGLPMVHGGLDAVPARCRARTWLAQGRSRLVRGGCKASVECRLPVGLLFHSVSCESAGLVGMG